MHWIIVGIGLALSGPIMAVAVALLPFVPVNGAKSLPSLALREARQGRER
jgi:hypothetical protein